ncbi:hypothetical protein Tco_0874442 [Tanacetum coccineum]|uniref:Uncharacterized protein n=1 Tax=Tanacetum coccineum TaxID=301880 RepID=A0ABQ5BPQ7_9ASTR
MDQDSAHIVAASKVPMLKPGEFELWRMRIEQYIQMIDYALWEVIENVMAQRRLEVKARSTLMMGIPNEHQLKFNSIKDAKLLLEAIEKRFGGNEATKKTQRNLLKQQYENFTAPSSEMLDQTFDRLQKLVSQLELLDEKLSQEDVNKNQPNSHQLAHEDLQQIHPDDIEEMDLRWQMAIPEWSVQCNHSGTFWLGMQSSMKSDNKKESHGRSVPAETSTSTALVSCDGLGGYDWSDQAEKGLNYALMAYSSLSSNSEIVDNCKKGLGYEKYNTVPPPYTGNFMPLTPDLSFTGLDEFVNKPVVENRKSDEEVCEIVRKNDDAIINNPSISGHV